MAQNNRDPLDVFGGYQLPPGTTNVPVLQSQFPPPETNIPVLQSQFPPPQQTTEIPVNQSHFPSYTPPINTSAYGMGNAGSATSAQPGTYTPPTTAAGTSSGGSKGKVTYGPSNPDPKIVKQFTDAGIDAEDAAKFAAQYHLADYRKKLPKELQSLVPADYMPKSQQPPEQQNPFYDPLAAQLFFTQTIAPYLSGLGNQMNQTADQYGAVQRELLGSVPTPPAYQAALRQSAAQQEANMRRQATTLQASTAAAPYYDRLLGQMSNVLQAQNAANAQASQASQATNLAGILAMVGKNGS